MSVLHSFSIKNIFNDKMGLRFFYLMRLIKTMPIHMKILQYLAKEIF